MRTLIVRLVRLLVGVFYRRVELSRSEIVPASGPLLLVANHFNGLVDPMIVMAVLDRPVVFVAKSTLWRIPLLKGVLDSLGVVPVIRKVDAAEGEPAGQARNEASFELLADALRLGGAVLIFPEGRSHSDPAISRIRTGAARILLLAGVPAAVLPLGLWFTRKEEFRSDVLVKAGDPVPPPREPSVEGWTEAIRDGLERVTLNAESWREHDVVAAVEGIYGEKLSEGPPNLERSFRSRRLLLDAREKLEPLEPGAVARLARRARAFARLLLRVGLAPSDLDGGPTRGVLGKALRFGCVAALLFPLAVLGVLAFYAPYRSCGIVAGRLCAKPELKDQIALMKILVGLVGFPLATVLWVLLILGALGPMAALAAAVVLPLTGLVALWYLEFLERDERDLRAALRSVLGRGWIAGLKAERDALRAECDRLAEVYLKLT